MPLNQRETTTRERKIDREKERKGELFFLSDLSSPHKISADQSQTSAVLLLAPVQGEGEVIDDQVHQFQQILSPAGFPLLAYSSLLIHYSLIIQRFN